MGIGTTAPDASAALDIVSSAQATPESLGHRRPRNLRGLRCLEATTEAQAQR